ncbi:MAG: phosphate-responsive 1 family protein [Gemmatimonadetes bacterium]|nr:phosphate-responsive 1 family protein [Gemmatimonadota bacterium]
MPRVTLGIRTTASCSAALFALTLSACSDKGASPTQPSLSPSTSASFDANYNENQSGEHGHVMHIRNELNDGASPAAAARASGTGISYHGGPVLQSGTNMAAIYWAASAIYKNAPAPGTSGAGSADASLVGYFLNHIGGSPYFNINSSYTNSAGLHIVNSVSYTQYWANNTSAPTGTQNVTDAQMISMLQSGFNSGKLTYDPNTLYAIFTAGQVNLGGGFGTQYCAYHTHGTVTIGGVAKTVLYAAMPYNNGYPSACTSGLAAANGAADPGADYEVNTLVHEIEETTTDMMGNAWYDSRGYENGDKCAWTWGTTYTTAAGGKGNINLAGKDFLVQQNWLNAGSGGCFLKY